MNRLRFLVLCGHLVVALQGTHGNGHDLTGTIEIDRPSPQNGGKVVGKVDLHITGSLGTRDGNTGVASNKCDPLETLLDKFVTSPMWKNIEGLLQEIRWIPPNGTSRDVWDWVYKKTGYEVRDPVVRHSIACGLYENDADLLVHLEEIKSYYLMFIRRPINDLGMDNVVLLVELIKAYAHWAVETGYPRVPLRNTQSLTDLEEIFTGWSKVKNAIIQGSNIPGFIATAVENTLEMIYFPIARVQPSEAARIVYGAGTTERMLEELKLPVRHLENFMKMPPRQIEDAASLGLLFLRIIHEITSIEPIEEMFKEMDDRYDYNYDNYDYGNHTMDYYSTPGPYGYSSY